MPRPNFFIAGAAKCGTTSLHAYLRQHPEVFMSTPKEPRFFDTDLPAAARFCVRDPEAYHRLFDEAEGKRVIGEASPSYLVSRLAAERIHEYAPEAKVLISLRNPIDFMFSLHRQFVGSCNEDLHRFEDALEAEPDRAAGERIPDAAHYPGQLLYRHNARFAEQVERFYDRFGQQQVKVVLMEDLGKDPVRVFGEVLRFLGLPESDGVDLSARNAGETKRLRNFRVRALMKKHAWLDRCIRSLPVSVGTAISDLMVRFSGEQVDARTKMAPETRRRLTEEFVPEIDRLSKLIGRDLDSWKEGNA
ncbi:Sulfotransferase domain protein [Planctomycetes bacterium MalM25]|nr:Sulfotransferase domain protein [Planctomycetes bacterium MalM25]